MVFCINENSVNILTENEASAFFLKIFSFLKKYCIFAVFDF